MIKKLSIVKISLISILIIILLIIAGAIALVKFVDPNRYKPLIINLVNQNTGRKLSLSGNISWQLYPNLGLHIGQASLSNPIGFNRPNLIEIGSIDVSIKLIPLFYGSVIVDRLAINDLNLALIKDGNTNNWSFNLPQNANEPSKTDANKAMTLEFSSLVLKNATITYDDMVAKTHQGINNFDFNLDTDFTGKVRIDQDKEIVTLKKVNFNFDNKIKGKLNLTLNNFSKPTYDGSLDLPEFSINQLLDKLSIANAKRVNKSLLNKFALQTTFTGDINNISFSQFDFNFPEIFQGKVNNFKIENFKDPKYSGLIDLSDFSLNKLLDSLDIAKTQRVNKPLLNKFALQTSFSGTTNTISLSKTNFKFADTLQGNMNDFKLQNFANPDYSGSISLPAFSLNKVLDDLNIAKAERVGKTLLNNIAIQTKFTGNMNAVDLSNLNINLPNTLQASIPELKIQNFSSPQYSGSISLPSFPLNKVLDGLNIAKTQRVNKPLLNKVGLQTSFTGTTNEVYFSQLSFNFPDYVQGSLPAFKIQNFSKPQFSGNITLPVFSLNKVLDGLDIAKSERANKPLLNKFAMQTGFSGSMNDLNLSQFNFNFPDTMQGSLPALKIQNFKNPEYVGSIVLAPFSLNNLFDKLGIKKPELPNKALLNKVALQTHFAGNTNKINLEQINFRLSDATITGNLNVSSIKPIKLAENINIDKLELSDFVDTKGFKLLVRGANVNGNLGLAQFDDQHYPSTLNAEQHLTAQNINLAGFSVNNFVSQVDHTITITDNTFSTLNTLQQINNSIQVVQSINTMKAMLDRAKAPGAKDLSQHTDLGNFQANLVIKNGVAMPTNFKLNGPSIRSSGQGSVNLNQKTLDYNISTQLSAPQSNQIINHIVFAYHIQGKFSDTQGSVDWLSIQRQIAEYLLQVNAKRIKDAVNNQVKNAVDSTVNNALGNSVNQGVKDSAHKVINSIFGQ